MMTLDTLLAYITNGLTQEEKQEQLKNAAETRVKQWLRNALNTNLSRGRALLVVADGIEHHPDAVYVSTSDLDKLMVEVFTSTTHPPKAETEKVPNFTANELVEFVQWMWRSKRTVPTIVRDLQDNPRLTESDETFDDEAVRSLLFTCSKCLADWNSPGMKLLDVGCNWCTGGLDADA